MGMREKLIELQGALGKSVVWGYDDVTDTDYINYEETAKNLIANGVTIPVRCKDCVSYQETMGKDSGKPCGYGSCFNPFAIITGIVYDEDFCSYGERRSDD